MTIKKIKPTIIETTAHYDVNENERAEHALRLSEEKFHALLDNIEDGYYETDLGGNLTFFNDSACRISGYSRDEFMGMSHRAYTNQETAKKVFKAFNTIYTTGNAAKGYDYEIIRKDGTKRHVEVSINLMKDATGNKTGFRGIIHDITERKQAEQALRSSEEKYRTILESIEDGYYETDLAGNFTFFNNSICRIWGYPNEELMGMNNRQYMDKETAGKLYDAHHIIFTTGEPGRLFDYEIIRKDGERRIVQSSFSLLKNTENKPVGFRGIVRDITEHRRAEEALIKSEANYRRIVETAQEGIFQATTGNNYINLNHALATMLGYDSPEEVIKSITDISRQIYVHPEDYQKINQTLREEGAVKGVETEFYRKDGSRIWVNMSVSIARGDSGHVQYYQGIVEDISIKKIVEIERQDSIDRLRKSLGATINAMSATVEAKDPYTAGHQRRVADLARAIATEMTLSRDQIDGIRLAGMIHDLGKISVPSEILTKPTKLSDLEFRLIQTHPEAGYNILKDIEFPWPIARIVLEHHERMDGSGYPNRLKGEDILLESKIIAVADVVEAISSHRPYRPALGISPALDEITKNNGKIYDPDVVAACLLLFKEKRYTMPV